MGKGINKTRNSKQERKQVGLHAPFSCQRTYENVVEATLPDMQHEATGKLGLLEKGVGYLLALVERSFEFLLMLTLLSFFLGVLASFSVCWLEDEDEEELVLALESSSDIANPPPHPANGPCRGRKQNRNTDHAGAAKRELRCQEGAGRAAPAALQRIGAHRRTGRRSAGAAIARGRPG